MTDNLVWADATEADLPGIRALRCSEGAPHGPDGELVRPRHELEVEAGLREDLHFPLGHDEGVLIARDDRGVAAVSWWWHKSSDARHTKLLVMAVAARWRSRRIGDELYCRTQDRIVERAKCAGTLVLTIWGSVRLENTDGRELMTRKSFWEDPTSISGGLSDWYLRIDLRN